VRAGLNHLQKTVVISKATMTLMIMTMALLPRLPLGVPPK
jgi:hypothetical protein